MHDDPGMARVLHEGRIDHFVAVTDAGYNDIRTIFARTKAALIDEQRPSKSHYARMGQ
jgi:hypothetical protein